MDQNLTPDWSVLQTGSEGGMLAQIMYALGQLQHGQALNRAHADQRDQSLRDHMDLRMSDLRDDLHSRMDGLETRVDRRVETLDQRVSDIEKRTDGPWWKAVSPKEALGWVIAIAVSIAHIRDPSMIERILPIVGGK